MPSEEARCGWSLVRSPNRKDYVQSDARCSAKTFGQPVIHCWHLQDRYWKLYRCPRIVWSRDATYLLVGVDRDGDAVAWELWRLRQAAMCSGQLQKVSMEALVRRQTSRHFDPYPWARGER